jgi:hypothetical protein
MSTIKTAYNTLEHLLDVFHLIKNAKCNGQENSLSVVPVTGIVIINTCMHN